MREEARVIEDTLADIEAWLDKLKMLAEEVGDCIRLLSCARWDMTPFDLSAHKSRFNHTFLCPRRVQPQNSMPDVIIWMLRGEKRVAYSRIPAQQILYSTYSEQACGRHCGKTQAIFMQVHDSTRIGHKINER